VCEVIGSQTGHFLLFFVKVSTITILYVCLLELEHACIRDQVLW
jgi:hypothetical protein